MNSSVSISILRRTEGHIALFWAPYVWEPRDFEKHTVAIGSNLSHKVPMILLNRYGHLLSKVNRSNLWVKIWLARSEFASKPPAATARPASVVGRLYTALDPPTRASGARRRPTGPPAAARGRPVAAVAAARTATQRPSRPGPALPCPGEGQGRSGPAGWTCGPT